MPSSPGYDNAMKTAVAAFDLIQTYQTPPVPEAYEIFYAYACDNPTAVIQRVQEAAAINGTVDLHQIHGIHADLFSYPKHCEATRKLRTRSLIAP